MFEKSAYSGNLLKDYDLLSKQLDALSTGEKDTVALLSNASALLNQFLDRVNWTGFYINQEDELVLGPFQGLPACIRIPFGKGVCGTAAATEKTQRIADVHSFPGHIACDAASRSEIVIPININGKLFGVLDIDSPETDRFTEEDERGLSQFVKTLEKHLS
ncbi:GAF domain-containing protein [Aciduricibacillus chroicocephali]|uniref:GAF domain-containing protein n=1 Tax=Aciduricibacillus chroicocephali TaxID=3054939 RepID=A0ABY9KSJ8_9BACI|nr:GAF domain-containing protein [Bacillaceae bacterium 44XB]